MVSLAQVAKALGCSGKLGHQLIRWPKDLILTAFFVYELRS